MPRGDAFAELDAAIAAAAPAERAGLVVALAARLAQLGATLAEVPTSRTSAPAPHLLTVEEAVAVVGGTTSKRWLLSKTRGLAFRRDLSRKAPRFDEAGLRAWLARRAR